MPFEIGHFVETCFYWEKSKHFLSIISKACAFQVCQYCHNFRHYEGTENYLPFYNV